jgi:hypothetical protein
VGQGAAIGRAFSVDGTRIEAWASLKSLRPKNGSGAPPAPGRNGERDFHVEKRRNETPSRPPTPMSGSTAEDPGQARRRNGEKHRLSPASLATITGPR